jgi:quercetin dioxygenase-like cupin family protein
MIIVQTVCTAPSVNFLLTLKHHSTHTGAYHAIVLKGVMTNSYPGMDAKEHEPGSYWYISTGAEHTTACISAKPCEWIFCADGKFDFAVVE